MKKYLLLAVCALAVGSISAQEVWSSEAPDKRIEIGPRVGLNVASMSNLSMNSKAGINAGLAVNVGIVKSMYINTGVFFTTKGATGKFEGVDNTGAEFSYKRDYAPCYVEIPLEASYRYSFNPTTQWQLNFGPYFAVGTGGKYTYTNGPTESKYDMFGDGVDGLNCKRFDMGLAIGTGVNYRNFFFGMRYEFALTNVYKFEALKLNKEFNLVNTDKGVKNGVFSINVGYNF